MGDYYQSDDLGKFAEIGKEAPELWKKFLEYYSMATGTGALTKREKMLIGLSVAHTIQCPYCIDAYSKDCLANGVDVEQMTEAVHVAAAVMAGATLVHGVQMRNITEKLSI